MTLRWILRQSYAASQWPLAARLAGAAVLLLLALAVRLALWGISPQQPFITYAPMLVAASACFGRGPAWAALGASALVAVWLVASGPQPLPLDGSGLVALLLYVIGGGFIVEATHALRAAYAELKSTRAGLEEALRLAEMRRRDAEAKERALDLLMQESAHRMKNDLARLAALLRLQSSGAEPAVRRALADAASRMLVLARMHDRLSRRDGEVLVDASALLTDIVAALGATAGENGPVRLAAAAPSLLLPAETAGPVGLIANEWLTNALKHAFPAGTQGRVEARLRQDGAELVLEVADDGVGLAAGAARSEGMGQRLVAALAAQIGGEISSAPTSAAGGTTQTLRIPARGEALAQAA